LIKSTIKERGKSPQFSHNYTRNISLVSNKKILGYINDLITFLNKKIGKENIISVLLFGSNTYANDTSKISDVDLLIILSDNISDSKIKSLEKFFSELELKHGLRVENNNLLNTVIRVIEKSTGMYISHFITRKKHWLAKKFAKIFRVNRTFAYLFAPRNLVLKSMISSSKIILGKDLRYIDNDLTIHSFGMIKSIILNLFISIFAIIFDPIYDKSLKYELEAIKWSLKASNIYLFNDTCELKKMADRFVKLNNNSKGLASFFKRFLYLRSLPIRRSFGYSFLAPINILKIHMLGLSYKKLIKDKR